ncbi:MAG: CBS domain-containing protein [Candidatus Binataceae bacterium]|jgi:CBS domain-containing protein
MSHDEELERTQEEEAPGPSDLESVLVSERLSDAMGHPAVIVGVGSSLAEAIAAMQKERRGCVLVVSGDKLAGILTERDVLLKIAGLPIDLKQAKVSDYMTRDPVALPAEANVAFALNRMVVEGFRHIPLVDDQGCPTGVVSMRELIEYLSDFFRKDILNLPPDPRPAFQNRDGG